MKTYFLLIASIEHNCVYLGDDDDDDGDVLPVCCVLYAECYNMGNVYMCVVSFNGFQTKTFHFQASC